MRVITAIITAALLTVCASPAPAQDPANDSNQRESQQVTERVFPPAPRAGNSDVTLYASQLQRAIRSRINNTTDMEGKTCSLHIRMNRNAQLESVRTVGGDPKLCQTLMSAMSQASLPAFPDEGVYQVFKDVHIDLKW